MSRTPRTRAAGLAGLVTISTVGLVLAGCTPGGGEDAASSRTSSQAATTSDTPTAAETATESPTPSGLASTPFPGPEFGQPAAVLSRHVSDSDYRLAIWEPVRTADGVVATAQISYDRLGRPDDWTWHREMASDGSNFSVYDGYPNGILLVDMERRRAYRPSVVGYDDSICGPLLPREFSDGLVHTYSCLYRIPEEVTEVTVRSTLFGQVRHVPIRPASEAGTPLPTPTPTGEVVPKTSEVSGGTHDLSSRVTDTTGTATVTADASKVDVTLNSNVLFGKDSATIQPAARARLAEIAAQLKQRGAGSLAIVGYTDDLGSAEHGLTLSGQRAAAVAKQLGSLPGITVTTAGKGEADPVVANTSEANRAKNRRVELHYRKA